jgi:hypothetical protein
VGVPHVVSEAPTWAPVTTLTWAPVTTLTWAPVPRYVGAGAHPVPFSVSLSLSSLFLFEILTNGRELPAQLLSFSPWY